MSWGQTSLAVKGPAVKRFLRSSFSNLAGPSKILRLNVSAVKCSTVKRQWLSKVPRSNVTCGQMSCGQMSLVVKCLMVKCPAVKCHLGQMSRGQMSSLVKCHIGLVRSNVPCGQLSIAVYYPAVKRPRSNECGHRRSNRPRLVRFTGNPKTALSGESLYC